MPKENKKTILLVEDEIITAMLEKKQLEKMGYIIHHVSDGEKAVKTILDNSLPADLILMDIDLGDGIDGTQAAEQILKQKDIPVVFLSSHTEPEVVEKTEKITSYGYVVKNSNITVLDASIKMAFKLFNALDNEKKKEAALQEIEEQFSKFFFLSPLSVTIAELNTGLIINANDSFENFLGYTRHEIIGKSTIDLGIWVNPEERQAIVNILREKNKAVNMPAKLKKKSGEILDAEFYCSIIIMGNKSYLLSTAIDITYRKQAEEALRKSEEKYRLQFMNMDSYNSMYEVVYDKEGIPCDFRFLMVNQAYEEYVGKKASELIGKTLLEVYPETEQYWIDKMKEAVFTGSPLHFENFSKVMNTYTEINLYIPQKGWLAMTTANIKGRKQAEEALRESEELYKNLFQKNHTIMILIDPASGAIVDANPAAITYYGWSHEELLKKKIEEINTLTTKEIQAEMQLARKEERNHFIFKHRRADGSIRDVEVYSGPLLLVGKTLLYSIVFDITAYKQADETLRENEIQYRNLADAGMALIWRSNTDKLCYYFNKPWLDFTGRTLEKETGNGWTEGVHPEDFDQCLKTYLTAFDKREKFEMEYRLRHVSGEYRWILDLGTPNYNAKGEFVGYIGHCFDVTGRKLAEEEIKRQLSEKETLLKEVHHRIKNNIASIEGLLSLQADSTDNAEVKTALQESISRIQSTRVLYEKLLMGKDYQDVSIKNYIESLVDSLIAVFPESKNVTIEKKINDFTLNSNKVIPIGIMINELMTNIFKYAFKGRDSGRISINLDKTETHVTLTIQDNGIGIDESINENKTQGFGLTIVKMLAEQLKGTYAIKNDKGTKSVLKFEI